MVISLTILIRQKKHNTDKCIKGKKCKNTAYFKNYPLIFFSSTLCKCPVITSAVC